MSATVSGDAQLASRLSIAVSRLHRRVRIATNDVPPLQLSTLVSIEAHGPLRLGELAQREAVTAPTMSRVLVALCHRGLIVRTIDAEDARSVRVGMSPEGIRVLAEVRARRAELLDIRLARLSPEQREALATALPVLEAMISEEY
ncbi:MarR family winged helix-turn-helix transcriptional regulator [Streptosporangium sp. G11]|uniref:MarR family winged helix-turn-helix transcriptional regulator n=1 Tax=Streptosporangium sp. G11 TaxID=3436926 RepID=UPI003EBCF44E